MVCGNTTQSCCYESFSFLSHPVLAVKVNVQKKTAAFRYHNVHHKTDTETAHIQTISWLNSCKPAKKERARHPMKV